MQVRCPQCHMPIDLASDGELSDIACPSCGSSFSLLGSEETAPLDHRQTKTIGHFELIEQVGVGQFGSVWKARDTELDRIVAIKVPRSGKLHGPEAEQFLREARAAAQVRHSNIVSVHEVGREDDKIYIVSDFVEGANLSEWLSGQRLTSREAAELCAKLADALHQAHEAGVTHRDLKPGNIMLTLDGEPIITDFGLAKRDTGEITMTMDGRVMGTPAYMSPEQARGEAHQADRRSDIYSLGVILYELLIGELPFRGETRMLIVQILRDEPPSPRKLNSRIPRDLETICLKCLEKDPEKRYQTAGECGDDLRRFLAGEPIEARPVSRIEKGWRWCKRNPVVATLTTLFLLTLLIGLASTTSQWIRAQRESETNRRLLYASDMIAAGAAWEDNDVARVQFLLQRNAPSAQEHDLRRFEWYHLWHLCNENRASWVTPQADWMNSVAFSRDGRLLAAAGRERIVRVWNVDTREELNTFSGHEAMVVAVAFTPDSQHVGSISVDGCIKVWPLKGGEEKTFQTGCRDEYQSIAFSPVAGLLGFGGSDGSITLLDIDREQVVATLEGHAETVTCVTFSANGALLLSGSRDGTLKLWDVKSGDEQESHRGHTASIRSVAFSPTGEYFASGSDDSIAKIWPVGNAEGPKTLQGHTDEVQSVAFTNTGSILATASRDNTIRLWEVETATTLSAPLKGHSGVEEIAFSPVGDLLASAGCDDTVRTWKLNLKRQRLPTVFPEGSGPIALASDGRVLALIPWRGTDAREVTLWPLEGGGPWSLAVGFPEESVRALCVARSDILVLGLDRRVLLWDLRTRQPLPQIVTPGDTGIVSVEVAPGGHRLAVGTWNGSLMLYEEKSSGYQLAWSNSGHNGRGVMCLAFSPDAERLVSGGEDHNVISWNASTGEQQNVFEGHDDVPLCTAFSSDGKTLASGGFDYTIKLWDCTKRSPRPQEFGKCQKQISFLKFCDEDKTLISTSGEGLAIFWDTDSGQQRYRAKQASSIDRSSVAFSEPGNLLAIIDRGGESRLWRAATPEEVDASDWWQQALKND